MDIVVPTPYNANVYFEDASSRPSYRRTKIVATLGPASRSPERVAALIRAGVNVFRLNFSHGSHEEHLQNLLTIREVASELGAHVAVLQDLSGPKIRISAVEGEYAQMQDNEEVELRYSEKNLSTAKLIYVEGLNPCEILKPGEPVLLADGIILLRAVEVSADRVKCTVVKGGRLRSRVGIAFPDSAVDLPATTEKDFVDFAWGIKNKIDFVAISFVQDADDVLRLKEEMKRLGGNTRIISKIERKKALKNIDQIVEVSDGVMVARGDLGLEIPLERVPLVQRGLIEKSNHKGIPVIVATQMLHSMITSVRPTRAEVSDIAAAVMSGADAVMLSEETAIGEHPVESVEYLSRIAQEAERSFSFEEYKLRMQGADRDSVPDAVAYAACAAANKVHAGAIIACTETGSSARLLAKYRPMQPLYAASANDAALRRIALNWGTIPIKMEPTKDHFAEFEQALRAVAHIEQFESGSRVVMTGGLSVSAPGSTSLMEIREV